MSLRVCLYFFFFFLNRADTNNNSLLTHYELSRWIEAKIQQHINQAHAENYILFASVDVNPRNGKFVFFLSLCMQVNLSLRKMTYPYLPYLVSLHPGLVSWEEYHQYFLKQRGYSQTYAESHDKHHPGLDRKTKGTCWCHFMMSFYDQLLQHSSEIFFLSRNNYERQSSLVWGFKIKSRATYSRWVPSIPSSWV